MLNSFMYDMLPIIVLFIVFILIAVRQIGSIKLKIWQIMLGGALAVIITGNIRLTEALQSINIDVMIFLFCMFVIGRSLEESGYLSHLSYKLFKRAKSSDHLVLFILFGLGILSAFLMNDTLAIIGTPVVLLLATKHNMHPKVLLLSLAFAITIGSAMSPIGNPQNLLIALTMQNPFVTFFRFLLVPTLINLFAAYILLKIFYKDHFHKNELNHSQEPIKDHNLSILSKVSLILLVILIITKVVLVFSGIDFKLTYIAIIAALPILIFSNRRIDVVRTIDWFTLIFFASMFILMQSVWNTGFFQSFISSVSIPSIFIVSVLVSQLISNVPLVALYTPLLTHLGAGTKEFVALAAGSTIAGNLLILGAASNVIIIQNAENKGETISFIEFAKIGIPLTIINVLIYYLFLMYF